MHVQRFGIKGDRRMIKYKRRTINQNALLHDHEFVTVEDVEELMMKVIKLAVESGADKVKLMEVFGDE